MCTITDHRNRPCSIPMLKSYGLDGTKILKTTNLSFIIPVDFHQKSPHSKEVYFQIHPSMVVLSQIHEGATQIQIDQWQFWNHFLCHLNIFDHCHLHLGPFLIESFCISERGDTTMSRVTDTELEKVYNHATAG